MLGLRAILGFVLLGSVLAAPLPSLVTDDAAVDTSRWYVDPGRAPEDGVSPFSRELILTCLASLTPTSQG